MTGTTHVVGAGVAGLAAALAAARAGRAVALHEATAGIGGRCRPVEDGTGGWHDNGTHVLLGANRAALAFLEAIGARAGWIEPEPGGLPVLDLVDGALRTVGHAPRSWLDRKRRPPGLGPRALGQLARLALPGPDRPVTACITAQPFLRSLVEPLTVAALNTPVAEASSRRLAAVLRRMGLPGAGRVLVARDGLGPGLAEPALAALARAGVALRLGRRLRGLAAGAAGAERLLFADGEFALSPGDRLILALPPHELARILPGLDLPTRYEPIVNLHFAAPPGCDRVRFAGLIGGTGQWVLFRPGRASVTVSAARAEVDLPPDALAARVWPEVRRAAAALSLGPLPGEPPPVRVIKERRATVSQAAGPRRLPSPRPYPNVALAGDWLTPLPATIEAAVRSGTAAAGGWPRWLRLDRPASEGRHARA